MTAPLSGIPCPVCQLPLTVRLAQGRKSGKSFVMLVCPRDGRHFRGFITDQPYVKEVLAKLEGQAGHMPAESAGGDVDLIPHPPHRSGAGLQRGRGP